MLKINTVVCQTGYEFVSSSAMYVSSSPKTFIRLYTDRGRIGAQLKRYKKFAVIHMYYCKSSWLKSRPGVSISHRIRDGLSLFAVQIIVFCTSFSSVLAGPFVKQLLLLI